MVVRSRRAIGGAAAVALAVAAAVVGYTLVKSAPSGGSRAPAPESATAPAPAPFTPAPPPGPTVAPATGPRVPAHGAYVGAYTQPARYTAPDKIAAIHALQDQAGGRLDIVHSYLRWEVPFPKPDQQAIMDQGSTL